MRKQLLTAFSAILSVLLGSSAFAQSDQATGRAPQKPIALPLPEGTPKRPEGMQAFPAETKGARAFSVEAFSAYFKTHNLPMNLGSPADIKVEKVEILTDSALASRLDGESTGIGPQEKVVLVTLGGTFVFTGPPGSSTARATRAYAVFDAKNGNLLMTGTFGDRKD